MDNDILERHRKAEKRERPDVFDKWLTSNCHHTVPHDKLRNLTKDKARIIERLIEK